MLTIIYNTVKQAVENGDISALETWIEYGGNVNAENSEGTTFLQMAVNSYQLEVVKFLVKYGANVNAWKFLDKIPLTLSCKVGSLEIAEFLIHNGAEINPTDLIGTQYSIYLVRRRNSKSPDPTYSLLHLLLNL